MAVVPGTKPSRRSANRRAARSAAALLLVAASGARAVESQLASRPGEAEAARAIGLAVVQLSAGIELELDEQEQEQQGRRDTNELSVPNVRVDLGITQRAQVSLEYQGLVWVDEPGAGSVTESSDLQLAFKLELWRGAGWVPDGGVFAALSLPTGGDDNTSDGYDPSLRLLASWALPYDAELVANLGVGSESLGSERSGRILAVEPIVNLSVPLPWAGGLGAQLEYYAKLSPDQQDAHSIVGALVYALTPNLQLDVSAGGRAGGDGSPLEVGAGFSWRFASGLREP